eukprot:1341146-Amorphochlora_amoeboformis.AAC.1
MNEFHRPVNFSPPCTYPPALWPPGMDPWHKCTSGSSLPRPHPPTMHETLFDRNKSSLCGSKRSG